MLKYYLDWKIWAGSAIGVSMFFGLAWGVSIACVAVGGSPDVCGM